MLSSTQHALLESYKVAMATKKQDEFQSRLKKALTEAENEVGLNCVSITKSLIHCTFILSFSYQVHEMSQFFCVYYWYNMATPPTHQVIKFIFNINKLIYIYYDINII